jgi:D-3-phosphoglycerate dehydrogenase
MADTSFCPQVFDCLRDVAEIVIAKPDAAELRRLIVDVDAYLCTLFVRTDRDVIEAGTRLRAIVTPSTGLDHIDLEAARERGIAVLSLTKETAFLDSVTATAEMAWCLLLAVVRRLPWAFDAARQGHWARDAFRGRQLSGLTFGIVGYGRLGRIIAEYAKAFRMRVLACDVRPVEPAPGVELAGFERVLAESDVVSLHVHLTPENRRLINARTLAMMKRGAVLLNTSRGGIIDESALLAALEAGQLAGAGLDVIDGEWSDDLRRHPLIDYANRHENLVISPHIGGVTVESQASTLAFMARKLKDFLMRLP